MDVIEATRQLGAALQQDERYIRYAKAKLANDADEDLQNSIAEFNRTRMELEAEVGREEKDDLRVQELNEQLRKVYSGIMSSPMMVEYNTAKAQVDQILSEINGLISLFVEGEDPATCEISQDCSGSCATCGGCH